MTLTHTQSDHLDYQSLSLHITITSLYTHTRTQREEHIVSATLYASKRSSIWRARFTLTHTHFHTHVRASTHTKGQTYSLCSNLLLPKDHPNEEHDLPLKYEVGLNESSLAQLTSVCTINTTWFLKQKKHETSIGQLVVAFSSFSLASFLDFVYKITWINNRFALNCIDKTQCYLIDFAYMYVLGLEAYAIVNWSNFSSNYIYLAASSFICIFLTSLRFIKSVLLW